MITQKINQKILKAYVKLCNGGQYTIAEYGTYLLATIFTVNVVSYAEAQGSDNIVQAATNLIRDLSGAIIAISTAAAVVGVGSGAFLKKFSLGKMDRIDMGNKLITNSIWGWILINGLTAILNWAGGYINASDAASVSGVNQLAPKSSVK